MSSEFLDKDIVYVNSVNRVRGTSSSFQVNLSSQIRSPNDYDSCALLAFTCPKSYYLFTSSNNEFIVTESKTTTSLTIPVGNYSINTLVTALNTLLSTLNWTYTISQTNINTTGKLTFTVSGNSEQPIFDFSGSNSPYAQLGFDQTSYQFSSDTLTCVNVINLQLTNTVQLMTDMVEKNLLATIIPDNTDFSTIVFNEQNPSFVAKRMVRSNVQSANFYLMDGNTGKIIDLNGLNFSFKFAIYKKNTYYKSMLDDKRFELLLQTMQDPAHLKELGLEEEDES